MKNIFNKKPNVCTSIAVRMDELENCVREAIRLGSDFFEIRVDYLDRVDWPLFKNAIGEEFNRCILTCRAKEQGGKFNKSEKERIELLTKLAKLRPAYVDLELNLARENPELLGVLKNHSGTIISWHDLTKTPSLDFLNRMLDDAKTLGNIVKIVTLANNFSDNSTILELYRSGQENLVAFCMGKKA